MEKKGTDGGEVVVVGGGEGGGGKAIVPSSYSLPCTLSGGDVSIRMVWLGALSAITAMSCCAPCASGYQRGLSSRFVLGKRNKSGGEEGRKKEEKNSGESSKPRWSSKFECRKCQRRKKKEKGSRLGKDEKVQVIQGNFPCL